MHRIIREEADSSHQHVQDTSLRGKPDKATVETFQLKLRSIASGKLSSRQRSFPLNISPRSRAAMKTSKLGALPILVNPSVHLLLQKSSALVPTSRLITGSQFWYPWSCYP
jgi:hypothetical protein